MFFSYAHKDEALRDKLANHLKVMERTGVIESWHDRQVLPGEEWDGQIDDNLATADIILLLVSDDFLASDYCWNVEVKQALKRHNDNDVCVIPIILREVDWTRAPFSKLQALPKNAEAVANWANQDQAFTNIAKGIRKVAERLKSR